MGKTKPDPLEKLTAGFEDAKAANAGAAGLVLVEATRRLRNVAIRGRPLPEEYETQRLHPSNGPSVVFQGRLLGEFRTGRGRASRWTEGELWETPDGNWIAVSIGASDEAGERDLVTVTVIPAGECEFTRRCAAMDAFRWHDMARGMAKDLGWDLVTAVA